MAASKLGSAVQHYARLEALLQEKNAQLAALPLKKEIDSLKEEMNKLEAEILATGPLVNSGKPVAVNIGENRYMIEQKSTGTITLTFLNSWVASHWPPPSDPKEFVRRLWEGRLLNTRWTFSSTTRKRKAETPA